MRTRSIASGLAALALLAAALSCQNINVDTEKVDPCTFDHAAGKYSAPFDLEIENDDPAVEIWYTDDGTIPSDGGGTSQLYNDVVPIDQTTTIRAKGYKAGLRASDERAATFTFVWTRGADMPTYVPSATLIGRYGFACATIDSKIYCIGGWEKTSTTDAAVKTVVVYDASTNSWSNAKDCLTIRQQGEAVSFNGRIYLIGGTDESGTAGILNSVEEYNPETDNWASKAPMPTARYGHRLAVLGDEIFAFGGSDGTDSLGVIEAYKPSDNTWRNVGTMSPTRTDFGIGVKTDIPDKACIFGGLETGASGGYRASAALFDPTGAETWSSITDMPAATMAMATCLFDGNIFSMGGEQAGGTVASVYSLDPSAASGQGVWVQKTPLPTARKYLGLAAWNGKIYAIGGMFFSVSATPYKVVEIYEPVVDN